MVYTLPLLSLGILVTGSQVIAARNPVYSVFWLVITFIQTTLLFIILGLDFIALMTIIVYVGAIAILFLFVILMLQLGQAESFPWLSLLPTLIFTSTLVFLGGYLSHLPINTLKLFPLELTQKILPSSNIQQVGLNFYSEHTLLFIGAGYILLVAMVGAMILSKTQSSRWLKKQTPFNQISRTC